MTYIYCLLFSFTQADLQEDDIYFLDTWLEIYCWIGSGSGQSERARAFDTLEAYAKRVSEIRKKQVAVVKLYSENPEPVEFTRHFFAWSTKKDVMDFFYNRSNTCIGNRSTFNHSSAVFGG
jgi:hypothetical protein